jgi:hypothetical protein
MIPISYFRNNIKQVQDLHYLHNTVDSMTSMVLDTSDILRSEIVLAVSALDHFIHEIVRKGLLDIHNGYRASASKTSSFSISLGDTWYAMQNPDDNNWLDNAIRTAHGWRTFQHPDQIKSILKLIDDVELWPHVGNQLNMSADDVKTELKSIVDRRNKIAHEADIRPMSSYEKFPIYAADVEHAISFIEDVCECINQILNI